jgi:anti-sigma factor RsiW
MTCDQWQGKIDAYVDAEMPEAEARALEAHLQSCAACSSEALARSELKRTVHRAGKAFAPDADFRRRVQESIAPRKAAPLRLWVLAGSFIAFAVLLVVLGPLMLRHEAQQQRLLGELTDLHVSTLASENRVDVVSSDRHTVKPWFQGRLPFTFNLPELQGSPFELVGGKLTFLDQGPGAELLFTVRKHVLSVFIFKDSPDLDRAFRSGEAMHKLSFNIESWSQGGLRYFIVTDAGPADVDDLRARLVAAAQ